MITLVGHYLFSYINNLCHRYSMNSTNGCVYVITDMATGTLSMERSFFWDLQELSRRATNHRRPLANITADADTLGIGRRKWREPIISFKFHQSSLTFTKVSAVHTCDFRRRQLTQVEVRITISFFIPTGWTCRFEIVVN